MNKLSLGILSAATIAICSAATAQTTTCSKLKAECDRGVASREAQAVSQCPAAFKHCLKTGVRAGPGNLHRTISGVSA